MSLKKIKSPATIVVKVQKIFKNKFVHSIEPKNKRAIRLMKNAKEKDRKVRNRYL